MAPLLPAPLVVELNQAEGYRINPSTGDSIQPIINSRGDSVKTGVPIPARGLTMDPETAAPPAVVFAGDPQEVPAHLNIKSMQSIPRIETVHMVDMLAGSAAEFPGSSLVLLNSTGDTVNTGIPLPIQGRAVPCVYPESTPTVPPGVKENANMDIKHLDVYHGLISSQVISITEDGYGNIWFGSTGGGASRYDGKTLTHFTDKEGLSGSWITSILCDSQGNIWFGTLGEGIILFSGENFIHFTEKEGLSNNTIGSILEDHRGNLWFGTAGGGVSKYDGTHITHFSMKEGLNSNWILSSLEDSRGRLWFGTRSGVSMYNGEVFRHYTASNDPGNYPVNSILEDSQGKLWFGTSGAGAMMYNGETFTYFTEKEGFSNKNVESILEDRHGNLWFGTAGDGAICYRDKSFTYYTEDEGLSGNWIISIHEDSYGNLWFGSIGGGVSIINSQSFSHFTEKDGLSSRAVYSIQEESNGKLLFGTMFGGVSMYDGRSFKHFTEKEGFSSATVESVLEDSRGNLWFGSGAGGVIRYDGLRFMHYRGDAGFSNFSVGSMLEDRNGNIWYGTYGGGVVKYDGISFTHFTENEGLSNNLVESMLEDSQGNLWIGTLGAGVSMYDGETFTHFSEREGLSGNLIGSIMEDSHGNLWFGSMTAGACRYSNGSFMFFTEKEGICDNHILSIVEDNNGRIWLGTDQGLNLIEFEAGNASFNIHSFGLQDGLKGIHFLQNSALLDSKNRIWWGSNKSLTVLDLNAFEISRKAPRVHLNRIDLNGAFVDYRSQGDRISSFFNYPLDLELSYDRNHLTFHFSAIDWAAPHKINYSYRIEGLNENWSLPAAEPKAEYRNLPHGTHTFLVRAIGEAQIWSESVEYTFTIRPPWWFTWLARIAYVLILIILVVALVRWRTYRLKKRQKELENTVKERTLEISEKNEELNQRNQNITDSIEYAKRIQTATLPPDEVLNELLPEHFLLYRPLQIVSGDFYWLTRKEDKVIVAVVDCTGHGVPGAFMSMLGSALLNDIVNNMHSIQANQILNVLRDQVIASLRQTGKVDEARDGMDIALCVLDREKMELQYAGAHNSLYLIREGELTEIKADRMPIGISSEAGKSFTNHKLSLQKDDTLYLFSDGYVDQIGGERRKKFLSTRFKTLLLEIQDKRLRDQQAILESSLNEWMGHTGLFGKEYEQIDDIIVMGIKV